MIQWKIYYYNKAILYIITYNIMIQVETMVQNCYHRGGREEEKLYWQKLTLLLKYIYVHLIFCDTLTLMKHDTNYTK